MCNKRKCPQKKRIFLSENNIVFFFLFSVGSNKPVVIYCFWIFFVTMATNTTWLPWIVDLQINKQGRKQQSRRKGDGIIHVHKQDHADKAKTAQNLHHR